MGDSDFSSSHTYLYDPLLFENWHMFNRKQNFNMQHSAIKWLR